MGRKQADAGKIETFMQSLGRAVKGSGRVFLVGGASAVLLGWRPTTIDVDMKLDPEPEGVFEAFARLKDELEINVELAAPDDFIPPLPGWRDRSVFIRKCGPVEFWHYDFYAQALAKIERGHEQDRGDVRQMVASGRVETGRLRTLFEAITGELIRYPALDRDAFAAKVEEALADVG